MSPLRTTTRTLGETTEQGLTSEPRTMERTVTHMADVASETLLLNKIKKKLDSVLVSKVKWEGAHHPYLQLGELNCKGRSSRGLVEGILKAPRAAALRPNVMENSYDGRVGLVSILILNQPCPHFKWEETGVPGEDPLLLAER